MEWTVIFYYEGYFTPGVYRFDYLCINMFYKIQTLSNYEGGNITFLGAGIGC